MKVLNKNKTWDLVGLPEGKKAVECEWVFAVKHKANGLFENIRLVWLQKASHIPMG
jgi:hypothetical protein